MHGDLLPINNDENFAKAKSSVQKSYLKIVLQAKGESYNGLNDFNKKRNFFDNLNNLLTHANTKTPKLEINLMEDFHQVSSIIDADVLPKTCRRVKITKHGSDKPLGFYIRDGYSVRLTLKGLQKVPSIFISRVLPGGLAESTGLLAVNDEVLEVNGIDLLGKSIEQVTDMMVVNASNLILTIKPVSQNHLNESFISIRSNSSQPQLSTQQQRNNSIQNEFKYHDHLQKQQQDQRQQNLRQNNTILQANNILQTNMQQQQNNLQPSNSVLHPKSSFNNHPAQRYSSLRNNQVSNQKNLTQQNSSFNYPKSLAANHLTHHFQPQQQLLQQENQQQQPLLQINTNQFNSLPRQNLDQYNNYLKMHYQNTTTTFGVNQQQPTQQKSLNLNLNQNIYQNTNQIKNNYDQEVNGAVGFSSSLSENNNAPSNNNKNLIDCLRRNYFGVEEQNYEEDEEDEEEHDEVKDYVNLNMMINDKLKLRNVYHQTANNQGLSSNVN